MDLKAEAINRYIEQIIDAHINNSDIHFSWDSIKGYVHEVSDVRGLTKDTLVVLPIYNFRNETNVVELDNIAEIQNRIRSVPHNLNGYTLIFLFCRATNDAKVSESSIPYSSNLNLGDEVLNFSNFYNGRLKILFDYTKYVNIALHPDLSYYETDDYFDQALQLSNKYTEYPTNAPIINGSGCNGKGAPVSLNNMILNGEMKGLCIKNILTQSVVNSNITGYLDSLSEKIDEDKVLAQMDLNGNLDVSNLNVAKLGGLESGKQFIDINENILDVSKVSVDNKSLDVLIGSYMYNNSMYRFNRNALVLNTNDSNLMGIRIDPGIIQNIIYNVDGDTPYSTIVIWAKQALTKGNDTSMLTNPLFSDYPNLGIGENNYGFAFGPGGIYYPTAADENVPGGMGINAYESGFNYFKYNLLNKWVMYVFEFQHMSPSSGPIAEREPYSNFIKYSRISSTLCNW